MIISRVLDMDRLQHGFANITSPFCTCCLEAYLVSMEQCNHSAGVEIKISVKLKNGVDSTEKYLLQWAYPVTNQMRRTWHDEQYTTEHGAVGIAFVLIEQLTPYTVIYRSKKGTGFDYWLGDKDDAGNHTFQEKARLEISGTIVEEKASKIKAIVRRKLKQTNPTDGTGLPAIVVVMAFKVPESHVVEK